MQDKTACEISPKEIETIEKIVNLIDRQTIFMIRTFDSIIDNRIFNKGESDESKVPEENPVSNNKIDRIISELKAISNLITDFTNIRLKDLDKELEKL